MNNVKRLYKKVIDYCNYYVGRKNKYRKNKIERITIEITILERIIINHYNLK